MTQREATSFLQGPVATILGMFAVLAVLSDIVHLVPDEDLLWIQPWDGLGSSGNIAVSGLLSALGFLVGVRCLGARLQGPAGAIKFVAEYALSRFVLVTVVVVTVLLVGSIDATNQASGAITRSSVRDILLFRWNEAVRDNPLGVRGDLTSLWFFSVEGQLVAATTLVILVFGRWRALVGAVALVLAVTIFVERSQTLDELGWFHVSLGHIGRADAFLIGLALGAVAHRIALDSNRAASLAAGAAMGLIVLVLWSSTLSIDEYFRIASPSTAILTALFALGVNQEPDPRTLIARFITQPEVVRLGALWPHLVAWAGPVVAVAVRREIDGPVAFLLLGSVVMIVGLSLISERVTRAASTTGSKMFTDGQGWLQTLRRR